MPTPSDFSRPRATLKVPDFCRLNREALASMREDLSLSLPLAELAHLQKVYQKRPAPTLDEIYLFDYLTARHAYALDTACVASLSCDDAFVMETYADLLAKRHALRPDEAEPPTLALLAEFGNLALTARGLSLAIPEPPAHPALTASATPFDENGMPSLLPGDVISVILLHEEATVDPERVSALLADLLPAGRLKAIFSVREGGMLAFLLRAAAPNGLYLEPDRLTDHPGQSLVDLLEHTLVGAVAIVTDTDTKNSLAPLFEARSLPFVSFAKISAGDRFAVSRADGIRYSIDMALLRTRTTPELFDALLPHALPTPRLTLLPAADHPATHPLTSAIRYATDSPFHDGLYAAVAALCELIAAGVPRRNAFLAAHAALEPSYAQPRAMGNALALLLGLYRAQSELIFPGRVMLAEGKGEVVAYGFSPTVPTRLCSDTLTREGAAVCLVQPAYREDGLPDFESLRYLLTALECAIADGRLLALRPVRGDLAAAVAALASDRLSVRLERPVGGGAPLPPGAFLIETEDEGFAQKALRLGRSETSY